MSAGEAVGSDLSSVEGSAEPGADREPVLAVRDLTVEFDTVDGPVRAVDGVSYDLYPGETLAVVGETGSGKTVTALAVLGLLPRHNGRISSGTVTFGGQDLVGLSDKERRPLLGDQLSIVFQDPSSALNPVMTIGDQVAEVLRVHDRKLSRSAARERVLELLTLVGIPEPTIRYGQYPHEFSGGMCQRVVIAIAIANRPRVLIADEPTTAVDVTIQAQLLELLRLAREESGAATVLITHDLGVVAELADVVCVMYAGRIVETARVRDLFADPRHPYTVGLLACVPRIGIEAAELVPIPGAPPDLRAIPPGCAFHPRCELAQDICRTTRPPLVSAGADGQRSACHFQDAVPEWSAARRPESNGGTDDA